METKLYSIEEICSQLNIGKSTVLRYVSQGMPSKRIGRRKFYNIEIVRQWKTQKEINEKRGKRYEYSCRITK